MCWTREDSSSRQVAVAVFWRAILAIGIAAIIVGFVFLLVTIWVDTIHGLHALIP